MIPIQTTNHHGSHRGLLWTGDDSGHPAKVDAIIVPTARPVAYLKEAARAAHQLDCPLVTLHSRRCTTAHWTADYLGQSVDLIAIDVPDPAQLQLPDLETSRLLDRSIFRRRTDVSSKRNLGLVLSHMLGWERVVFLDDDIRVPNPGDLGKAVSLLDTHTAVGLNIGGFPDNSMVCHAFRDAGGWQETFIGGGALAVEVKRNRSFFPDIYNEDWFYLLAGGKRLQSVGTVGRVLQYPYDPYRADRARSEEFGDVLAEGTFWLLDQGKSAEDGDLAHWRDYLDRRRMFVEQIIGMVEGSSSIEPAERARMVKALKAALGRRARISSELCVDYMRALLADQERWQRHIQHVQAGQPREKALRSLARSGAAPLVWCTREHRSPPSPPGKRPRAAPLPPLLPLLPGELESLPIGSAQVLPSEVAVAEQREPTRPRRLGRLDAAHALIAAKITYTRQKGQSKSDDHGDEGPSQQLHS